MICIYWRDIPAQVVVRAGRKNGFKKQLSPRFAKAIDRAAMRAGKGSSDLYIAEWRREAKAVDGDLEALLDARIAAFEDEWSDEFLESVVKAGGSIEAAKLRAKGQGSAG